MLLAKLKQPQQADLNTQFNPYLTATFREMDSGCLKRVGRLHVKEVKTRNALIGTLMFNRWPLNSGSIVMFNRQKQLQEYKASLVLWLATCVFSHLSQATWSKCTPQ